MRSKLFQSTMAQQQLTLEKIRLNYPLSIHQLRLDTLKYLKNNCYTRAEMSYRIGVSKSSLSRFLNCDYGLQTEFLLNLINFLYYDSETKNSL